MKGDGIIQKAESAAQEYNQAAINEQAKLDSLVGKMEEFAPVTWTKTSDGDLAVGSTVVTSTGENFYCIGVKDNDQTAILLAKDCIGVDKTKSDYLKQSANAGKVKFSESEYWNTEATEAVDIIETNPQENHYAIYFANKYGARLGVHGRLMTFAEANSLEEELVILYGNDGNLVPNVKCLNYWLGTIIVGLGGFCEPVVVISYETDGGLFPINNEIQECDGYDKFFGVRPVVEVPVSKIDVSK